MNNQPVRRWYTQAGFWLVASAAALVAWTLYTHLQWRALNTPIHGLVGFFMGLLALIILHGLARLVLGARRHGPRWLFGKQALRVAGLSALLVVSLIVLFYNLELWRGKAAWQRVLIASAEYDQTMDFKSIVPANVPDSENFARADVFSDLYSAVASGQDVSTGLWPQVVVWGKWLHTSDSPRPCTWLFQEKADLAAWLTFARNNDARSREGVSPVKPGAQARNDKEAAQLLVEHLQRFDSLITGARAAADRPYCRFPLDYTRQMLMRNDASMALNGLIRILHVRASAYVALGAAQDALADIQLALRLAEYARQQPWAPLTEIHLRMLAEVTQPIWEGLASGIWSGEQLAELQQSLGALNPLAYYPDTVRMNAFALANFCETVIPTSKSTVRQSVLSAGSDDEIGLEFVRAVYPVGWSLQNQAAIHMERFRLIEKFSIQEGRLQEDRYLSALWSSSDPFFPIFVMPRAVEMLRDNEIFYLVQASLDQAAAACAIERFRLTKGRLPATLGELIPEFLPGLPSDCFTNQPLRYTVTGKSFKLYSVGFNLRDDAGALANDDERHQGLTHQLRSQDIVWTYQSR